MWLGQKTVTVQKDITCVVVTYFTVGIVFRSTAFKHYNK